MAFTGCRSTQYIPIESIRTDSIYINKVAIDSLILRDSVFIHEKGDTTYVEKYRYLYKIKERQDTQYIEIRDSVQVPYPVEKTLSKWQSFKIELGGIAMGVLAALIIAFIILIIIRTRNDK
jgi:hypothetical protein